MCQNGSKCISLLKEDGNYKCLCREGSHGKNCEFAEFATTVKPMKNTTHIYITLTTSEPLVNNNITATNTTQENTLSPILNNETHK